LGFFCDEMGDGAIAFREMVRDVRAPMNPVPDDENSHCLLPGRRSLDR